MTDDSEVGTLPRFARDVAVIAGGLPDSDRETAGRQTRVLSPFSGVLDVRVERGRAPTLDLSYLTLDRLVAPELARSAGGDTESPATHPDAGTADDDTSEPTVGDVLRGDDGSQSGRETPGHRGLSLDVANRSLAPLDRSPGGSGEHPEGSGGGAPGDTGPSLDTHAGAPAEQSPPGHPGPADAGPERTVVDQSGPAFAAGSGGGDAPSAPDQAPPRTGEAAGQETVAEASAGVSADAGSPSAGGPRGGVDPRGEAPRMVVARGEDGGGGESDAGDDPDPAAARDPDRSTDDGAAGGDEPLGALDEASADPESPLIDRLYRTLRERAAIERRRRGGR